ncbi:GH18790 [Drosophila grimshawi]|uniref:GH18790 n=1 Tax=Drosophila grimshawi TaxID=7222 RepID=B4JFY8_DROGR|nr:GH18790 [Drosophila grimshawi]
MGITMLLLLSQSKRILSNPISMNESYKLRTSAAPGDLMPHPINSSREQLLLLHRQKRYLEFPEGSSLQLVFDLIIPIVDYTNFAILGITCAVAWELPSKPPSEILENLRTRLNDGTLGTVRRNGSVPNNGDSIIQAATNWQAMHTQPSSTSASAATYGSNAHSYAYYSNVQREPSTYAYANSPNGQQHGGRPTNWHARQSIPKLPQWAETPPVTPVSSVPQPVRGNAHNWSDNWWQRNKERVQLNWREKQQQWSTYEQPAKRKQYNSYSYPQRPQEMLQNPPKHHVYPVFGKKRRRRRRDVEGYQTDDDVIEQMHLRSHLSSRALLFGKIERLYKSRQLNGTACIQLALCESAQRQERMERGLGAAAEPQSFIMELLSAIFQLPGSNEAGDLLEHISPHYLEAHQKRGNCRQIYSDCNHTFWLE